MKTTQSNSLYVQKIGEDDRIKGFELIDIGEALVSPHDFEVIRGPGDLALWAFQMENGTCAIEEREALRSHLMPLERRFLPLVRLQIATLFGTPDVATHIKSANETIAKCGSRSVDLWRDLVILLPRIRQAAYDNLRRPDARLRSSIDAIDLITRDGIAQIGVPVNLVENAGGDREFAAWLSPLKPIFAALGVARLTIQQRSAVTPIPRGPAAIPPSGLAIIHCLRNAGSGPASKLRDVRHLFHADLVAAGRIISPTSVANPREIVFLLIEDDPELISAAIAIAESSAGRSSMTGALIVPRIDEMGTVKYQRSIIGTQRFSKLASHCHWIAFAGAVSEFEDEDLELLGSNPHVKRHTTEVSRWTPHALRACINVGEAGLAALRALTVATSSFRSTSITTMASRGKNAGAIAAHDALSASKRTKHPAVSAQLIVLVAFHNRPLSGETCNEIEHAALACSPEAKIVVVEEHRKEMLKRVRVVAFTAGNQPVAREAYTPPVQLMPLVRAGWRVGPSAHYSPSPIHTIRYAGHSYALRFEPELVVTLDNVDDIVNSTQMHNGEVALLAKAIGDDHAVERLLSSGIFCAKISTPQSFDRFGSAPGAAMRSAHASLNRPQICERLGQLARHYALAGLWGLAYDWQRNGQGIHTQWATGIYHREPDLELFELHRVNQDGTCFFRGIIRLDPTGPAVPRLRYTFGMALDNKGVRLTRMKPIDGEYDVRAENRRLLDERYDRTYGRHRRRSGAQRNAAGDDANAQLGLPGLSDREPQ
ncbi:hypothetical protein [Pseudolabrys sp.]|uniref:hypothetical protein n=1 Tax=Pseudolabrys sp. TaxID=1960880 RepID=UPI003D09F3D7